MLMMRPPRAGGDHRLGRLAGTEENPGEVDVNDPLPVSETNRLWRPYDGGPRIVDEDVEFAEALDGLRDHGCDGGLVGDIGRDRQALAADLLQAMRRLLHSLQPPPDADDGGASLGERLGKDRPQSRARPGHERDAVREIEELRHGRRDLA